MLQPYKASLLHSGRLVCCWLRACVVLRACGLCSSAKICEMAHQVPRGHGDTLRMVARGRADDAGPPLVLAHVGEEVECAAHLEGEDLRAQAARVERIGFQPE